MVTRVELFGGRCGQCGRRYRAEPPAAMPPGTPFDPGIRSLLAYLHHCHHAPWNTRRPLRKSISIRPGTGSRAVGRQSSE